MRVLILTCNTGGGHNAVAAALRDSLQRCGASCDVMDGLGFISKKASKFVSKWHTRFYRRYPRLYKAGYMSAEGDKEMDRRDGPVYRYIARGARHLGRTLQSGGYDAVVCVHVIPAMMMTALKQAWSACPVFCFVATDYTCSPTVGACTPDICVIPHQELADEFVSCGIARDTLLPAGIPVRSAFRQRGDRAAARRALGLPETGRHPRRAAAAGGYGGRLRNAERGVLHRPRLGGLLPAGQHGRVGPGLSGGRTAASGHHRCPEPRFRRPGRRPCGRRRPRPLQEMTPAPTAAAVGAFFALFVRRPSCISRKLSVYLLKKYRFVHRQVIFV